MSERLEIYKAIAEREKASRLEAERLLEDKARLLYQQHEALEKVATDLKTANNLFTEIMAVAPDGIVLCAQDLSILNTNSACEHALDSQQADLAGRRLNEFFPAIEEKIPPDYSGDFFIERIDARRPTGETFPAEIRGFAGPISGDVQYLLIFHDISRRLRAEDQRKQVEQQMDEARRLEAIGALSAGIAHEINTPIQFIGDNLDYLKDALKQIHKAYVLYNHLMTASAADGAYVEETNAIKAFNEKIGLETLVAEIFAALTESREGICQVRDIVLLMKEFAHPGTGDKEDADLNKIVENVVTLCKNRHKNVAKVDFHLEEALPPIKCRRGQVQQVLLNIVINAIDAIEEAKPETGRIRIGSSYDDKFVSIMISDNGPGVPESLRAKIFDPFFTTKSVGKGTGQGLALAKDCIVKGHGGVLTLAEIDGFSTTFVIRLPREATATEINMEQKNVFAA